MLTVVFLQTIGQHSSDVASVGPAIGYKNASHGNPSSRGLTRGMSETRRTGFGGLRPTIGIKNFTISRNTGIIMFALRDLR